MEPNPKYIFHTVILIGTLIIFVAILLFFRFKTGKPIGELVSEHNQSFGIAVVVAIALFILFFIVLFILNN